MEGISTPHTANMSLTFRAEISGFFANGHSERQATTAPRALIQRTSQAVCGVMGELILYLAPVTLQSLLPGYVSQTSAGLQTSVKSGWGAPGCCYQTFQRGQGAQASIHFGRATAEETH